METTWHKSSRSEVACAEATVLDLTVQGGVITGMAPVSLERVTRNAPSRAAAAETSVVGDPATAHDAWNAFAAGNPEEATSLLGEARGVFRNSPHSEVFDEAESLDNAIKTAFAALTDVDLKAPLRSQAELLYNQVVGGERYPVKAGSPAMVDAVIAELRSLRGTEPIWTDNSRRWLAAIRRGDVPVSSSQAAALRDLGVSVPSQESQLSQPQQTGQYQQQFTPQLQYGQASSSRQGQFQQPRYAPQQPQSGYGQASGSRPAAPLQLSQQELQARYDSIAPDLGSLVERVDYRGDLRELANPQNAFHFLVADRRDQFGNLSDRAMQLFETSRQQFAIHEFQTILSGSSVTVAVSDEDLRRLPLATTLWHPELESYLARPTGSPQQDRNGQFGMFPERVGRVMVNFHREPRPDPVVERRQQWMRGELLALQQRGYRFPDTPLNVYVPRYSDRIRVDYTGNPRNPVSISREGLAGVSPSTHFVPPNNIFLMPRSGIDFPTGYRRTSTTTAQAQTAQEIDGRGVYDVVARMSEAGMAHETAHFLHYQNNSRAMADLLSTALLDPEQVEATGSLSAYAGESPQEFVAEFVAASRYDMQFPPDVSATLHALNEAFGGPQPSPQAVALRAPGLTPDELEYVQAPVADALQARGLRLIPDARQLQYAQSQLQGFQQWAHLDDRASALADVIAAAARSANTRGTGSSGHRSRGHDYTARMTDDSDSRRQGLRQILANDPSKKFNTKHLGVLESASAQWSDRSSAFDVGRSAEASARDSVRDGKQRAAPLAALDAIPRSLEPALEPLSPELVTPEVRSYGVNAAPPGVGWTVARWVRSWDMSFASEEPRSFLDAVLAAAGGVVSIDGDPVRDAVLLRGELADRLRSDAQTPVEDQTWWPDAMEAYRSVTRQWMANGELASDLEQIERTIDAAIMSGEARQNVIALLDDSSRPVRDASYWADLSDRVLPFAISHYLERDLFVLGADGRASVYGTGSTTATGNREWSVVAEAADGEHRRTGWAAAITHGSRRAFAGLSGQQVAWAMDAGLRIIGAPGQGDRGVTFLEATGLVLSETEHERLVEALGVSAQAGDVPDDQWPVRAADHLDVALRVLDTDGTVREYGSLDNDHITMARTPEQTWIALAPARSPQDAAAATRVADVAGAPSLRVLEDVVEDDQLVTVAPPGIEPQSASMVLSADQERWALSHSRQVTIPPGGDLFGAVLVAVDGGLLVDQHVVTDVEALRQALVETSRQEQDGSLDLWLTVYSLYADHYLRRGQTHGGAADPLELAADVDLRVDTGAAMDDILTSITDPAAWPELADAVAPFLLNLLGVGVRVVRPDGGLDRYGQGLPAYIAAVPDDSASALTDGSPVWAALPSQVLRFPATSPLNALELDSRQLTNGDQDGWLREHQAVLGSSWVGPDGFFEAVLDASGGRLTSGGLDATSARELRTALSEYVTNRSVEPLPSFVHATYVFESEARIVRNHFDGNPMLADPRAVHDQIADHVRTGDAWHYVAQAISRPGDWDAIATALAPALLAERAGVDLIVVEQDGQLARYGTADGARIIVARTAGPVPVWAPVRPSAIQAASRTGTETRNLDGLFTAETAFVDTTATAPRQAAESVLDHNQRQAAEDENLAVVSTASGVDSFYEAFLASVGGSLLVDRHTYVSSPDHLRTALAGLVAERPEVLTLETRETIQRESGRSDTESIVEALREPTGGSADLIGAHLVGPYLGVELRALTRAGTTSYGGRGRRAVLAPEERQGGVSGWTALADRQHGDLASTDTFRAALPSLPAHQMGALSLNQRSRHATKRAQGFQHVAPGKKVSEAGWHKSSYSGDYCVSASVVAFAVVRA
ncbi:hypothetical protein ACIGB8_24070 [Promicromonospora sukumoe]|uniref:hypothetical protein n=1 Tax=Promicromonospora sukumoe TaxID=88382 RepID=UPI0037C70AEA